MSSALASSGNIGRGKILPLYRSAQVEAWPEGRPPRSQFDILPWPHRTAHRAKARRGRPLPPGLAWPDRAGLVAAFIVAALCVFAWVITLLAVETVMYGRLNHMLVLWTLVAETVSAVPFWLVLRIGDFINGGPETRRKAALRRRIEPLFEADGTANSSR